MCDRVLGAVLAGGRSSRFECDKALAMLEDKSLLDWAVAALVGQVDAVIVCGRDLGLPDRPTGGLGPLGGLNAALHAGRAEGFAAVLSAPCDTPDLPDDLLDRLRSGGPCAYAESIPVIGLWPCSLADELDLHLRGSDRSMKSWARRVQAVAVPFDQIVNINTPEDLALLRSNSES